jgi:hypothetical protein
MARPWPPAGSIWQPALDLALDIVGELPRAGIGEIHSVVGSQPPGLAFDVGTELGIPAILVDETVPDIDEDDDGLVGPAAIEFVEKRDIQGGLVLAQWR